MGNKKNTKKQYIQSLFLQIFAFIFGIYIFYYDNIFQGLFLSIISLGWAISTILSIKYFETPYEHINSSIIISDKNNLTIGHKFNKIAFLYVFLSLTIFPLILGCYAFSNIYTNILSSNINLQLNDLVFFTIPLFLFSPILFIPLFSHLSIMTTINNDNVKYINIFGKEQNILKNNIDRFEYNKGFLIIHTNDKKTYKYRMNLEPEQWIYLAEKDTLFSDIAKDMEEYILLRNQRINK